MMTDVLSLEQYCAKIGCTMISPARGMPEWILQYDESTGSLVKTATKELKKGTKRSLAKNHNKIQSFIRKPIEIQFCWIKKYKFTKGIVHNRYLRKLGDNLLKKAR